MKVVRDNIPKEGIIINNVTFRPGQPQEVEAKLGKQLVERKGFKEVGKANKDKEGSE